MYSLPTAFSNSGIIGVSVGPGLRQFMRMRRAASGNDRNAVYALIASFERPYAFASSAGCASHHARAASKSGVASNDSRSSRFAIHAIPAVDAMLAIALSASSSIFGITCSVNCRSPQKFTSITSRSENVFGTPAQLNSMLTTLPIFSTVAAICSGSRRSHSV